MDQIELEAEVTRLFGIMKALVKKDGHLDSCVIADCKYLEQTVVIPLPWENSQQKQELSSKVVKYLRDNRCTFFALIAEVWTSGKEHTTPSEDPERTSAIMVLAETEDGLKYAILAAITKENDTVILDASSGTQNVNIILDVFGDRKPVN